MGTASSAVLKQNDPDKRFHGVRTALLSNAFKIKENNKTPADSETLNSISSGSEDNTSNESDESEDDSELTDSDESDSDVGTSDIDTSAQEALTFLKALPQFSAFDEEEDILVGIQNFYKLCTKTLDVHKLASGMAEFLLKTKLTKVICDLTITSINENQLNINLYNALSLAWNTSDVSIEIRRKFAKYPNYLESLKKILTDTVSSQTHDNLEPSSMGPDIKFASAAMSVAYNISRSRTNADRLRAVGFLDVFQQHLKSHDKIISLSSLAALACIVKEEESGIINAAKDQVEYLLTVLKKGLENDSKACDGWSTHECGSIIKYLAQNDTNKILLVDLNALPLLVKLGRTNNLEATYESVNAIWALCFDKTIQQKVVSENALGVVEFLMETEKKDVKNNNEHNEIKQACQGALWTIKAAMEMSDNKLYQDYAKEIEVTSRKSQPERISKEQTPANTEQTNHTGHVMISYNWEDQKLIKNVRDILKSNGYEVWMDIDCMHGSIFDAMSSGIEKAHVVLFCLSEKYKDSKNCRAEAEYADECRKRMVPLKTQRGYKPNGWLGIMCGKKKFFDLSRKEKFDDKMSDLLREMKQAYSGLLNDENSSNPPQKSSSWRRNCLGHSYAYSNEKGVTRHVLQVYSGSAKSRQTFINVKTNLGFGRCKPLFVG
ncbi:uncharacterized protein LOC127848073 isoform X2 [Dreissena polymorpha]|uniref:uncharacterized protein LOC127848073 isoform X2 n=1 Tax=Dreissena polymorpha TaxID=45954 RepID=UPI0022650984|nr:uncharacterized protein LOC127848073 isoform X2 [Dreissena polymorpha]